MKPIVISEATDAELGKVLRAALDDYLDDGDVVKLATLQVHAARVTGVVGPGDVVLRVQFSARRKLTGPSARSR